MDRFAEMSPEASAVVVGYSAWLVLVALVGPLTDVAAGASAVVEASVVAFEAPFVPVVLPDCDSYSHRSAPGILVLPASIVNPIHQRLYPWLCFHTWEDSRHLRGSGRPGCQVRCPPTFRTPLAISSTRLDGLLQSNLRIPRNARIADPIACASWIQARRPWMPFLEYCALKFCQ